MAAVLLQSVLDQNGPKWSKRPLWSKWPYSEPDFSIRETKMHQNGPFWSILALKRSILVHLSPPTVLWPFIRTRVWKCLRSLPPDPSPSTGYRISGPMCAQFLSVPGLAFGTPIERTQFLPVPALDKNRSPKRQKSGASKWPFAEGSPARTSLQYIYVSVSCPLLV